MLSIDTLSSVREHELNIRAEWRAFVSSIFGVLTTVYELLAVMSATLNLALEHVACKNSGIGHHAVISTLLFVLLFTTNSGLSVRCSGSIQILHFVLWLIVLLSNRTIHYLFNGYSAIQCPF